MSNGYVHGYHSRENERLEDQADTLVDLLHADTAYPAGSRVLEVGCGVGAQTATLARRSPQARFTSVDISADSLAQARQRVEEAGLRNVQFRQADIFALPFAAESFDHVFVCFVLEHLAQPLEALAILILQAWCWRLDHYQVIEVPRVSVAERCTYVLQALANSDI